MRVNILLQITTDDGVPGDAMKAEMQLLQHQRDVAGKRV
jgi:hypothetical protein